jgi:hypothetical protein
MQQLVRLQELCAAPEQPLHVLTAKEWNAQFRELGTRLPEQLVRVNATYGSGSFESIQSPVNGSFGLYASVASKHAISRLAELRLEKLRKPNAFPASLYFEPGGLLPIGYVAGSIDICLRTEGGNPDNWRMSLLRAKTNHLQNLDLSPLELLVALTIGSLQSELFSKYLPSQRGYRFKSFRETVQQWHAG